MNPKVSILIPIYRTSEYIEKCAESLFNQTFTDIEYIFVNDASPDDSIDKLNSIIDKYPNRKNQIKIIHHLINRGSAAARNTAIDASTGDYITFVDSDDYIDKEMVEELFFKALSDKADIVVSDYLIEKSDKTDYFYNYISTENEENFKSILLDQNTSSSLCSKLVRRYLYELPEIRVPEGLNYMEDRHIMTRIFYFANKIVKVDHAFYHYIQYNTHSITKLKNRRPAENASHQ